jgi:hypothetical protein
MIAVVEGGVWRVAQRPLRGTSPIPTRKETDIRSDRVEVEAPLGSRRFENGRGRRDDRGNNRSSAWFYLEWNHDLIAGLMSRCEVRLLNKRGSELGSKVVRGPTSPWTRSRLDGFAFARIRLEKPHRARSATATCLPAGVSFS